MGKLFEGGLFDNSGPQINPDPNLGMGNNNMLPPNSPQSMMSNMHDQNAMLKMYEQYNKPSFSQKLGDLGAAFRAAGAAPSQQGALWNQLTQTRTNRTSDIRNRFRQLQQDKRQNRLDKQNLDQQNFTNTLSTDKFDFLKDQYNTKQDQLTEKNALIGSNFNYTAGQPEGTVNKSIEVMDQMGNPESIFPGDPRYNYYNSALKAKEKAAEQKLLQKTSGVNIKGKKDVIWDKKQGSYRYLNSGEITRDKEFTKKYEKWRPSQHAANVATLSTISESLSRGDVELDGLSRVLSMMDPNNTTYIRAILDTKGLDTQERVLQVVQQSLRETLGAQFTAKEAENLLNRSYNPALPQAINAKRLKFLATITKQMGDLTSQKIDYFNENKSLAGFDEAGFDKKIVVLKQQLENYYDVLDKEAKNSSNSANRSVGGKSTTGIKFKIKNPTK
tara:strand:+ start:4957 stop:6288 length:1332 start_codon:yes stop_codon:yes gene_type:complete